MAPKRRIDDAAPFVADENHVSGRQRLPVLAPSAPHREFTTGFAGELTAEFRAGTKKLNRSYHDHVQSLDMNQVCSQEPFVDVNGAAEYARVESDLRNLYEVADYELVVFGSNEATQLGLAETSDETSDDASQEDGEPKFNDYAPLLNTRIPKARQVSAGGMHAVVLRDGTPYAWGSNDEGATAWRSGTGESSSDPRPITGFLSRDGENDNGRILQVACGNCHTIFLAAGRRVYVVGSYKDADGTDFMVPEEVGGKILTRHYSPVQVQLPAGFGNPIHVFSSSSADYSVIEVEHSAEESTLLTFGFGNSGELARGIPLPRTLYFDAKRASELKKHESKDLAFDMAFVLKNHMTPRPAIFASGSQRKKVLSVACGAAHLLVAAREPGQFESNVFSTGHNNYGQVGQGYAATPDEEKKDPKKKANFLELTMIESLKGENIAQVAAGEFHSLFLNLSGTRLFGCGRNDSGQLGIGFKARTECVATPQIIPFPPSTSTGARPIIKSIACGGTHSMALTIDQELYTWGKGNESLVTGRESIDQQDDDWPLPLDLNQCAPEKRGGVKAMQITGGAEFSMVLVQSYDE